MKIKIAFWVIIVFLILSLFLFIAGQTLAIFDYELTVKLGLQESEQLISKLAVEVNRSWGVADTIIYIPLIILSLIGLFQKKSWSLLTTASVMGISAYWSTGSIFALLFLKDVPEYQFIPSFSYWLYMGIYLIFGIWGICYLILKGKQLIE